MCRSLLAPAVVIHGAAHAIGGSARASRAVKSQNSSWVHQILLNGHTFTLPEGFTIEIAAKPPQVERPIVAAFDEMGRLYVCDSSGSNEKVAEQVKKKPHRIVRLEDTQGDGRFDQIDRFRRPRHVPEGRCG